MPPSPGEFEDRTADGNAAHGKWTALAAVLFLLVGFALFPGAGRDDAYITYWPAGTLASTGAITNYNGEAIEQSSSLTLVVALGFLRWISGASLITLGWCFGILCGLATLLMTARLARRISGARAWLPPVLLAVSHPFVYWSFSGMETALQSLLMVGWLLSAMRQRPDERASLPSLLSWTLALCAVRPESTLVLLCALFGHTVLSPRRKELAPAWVALGVSAAVLVTARAILFDSWLPQPALAKSGRPLGETLALGISYLRTNPWTSALLLLALLLSARRGFAVRRESSTTSRLYLLTWLVVLAQLGFAVLSGGDWMEGARFLAPVLPLALALLVGELGRWKWALLVFVLLPVSTFRFATSQSRSLWLMQEPELVFTPPTLDWSERRNLVHLRDEPMLLALDEVLAVGPADRPLVVLTGQGGLLLYRTLRAHPDSLHVIDRYGLLDRGLSASETARAGGGSALGLNLSYRALLENWEPIFEEAALEEPDVIFDVGIGGREGQALRERGYELVFQQKGEIVAGSRRQPAKQVLYLKREFAERLPAVRQSSFAFSPGRFD